jgi:ribonuclease Z
MPLSIHFVGVSGAGIVPGQETACYVINGNILIDTGWNAAISMQECGILPTDIDTVFFTHCHQDHTIGLPGLFFANSRRKQVRPDAPDMALYGPLDLPLINEGARALLRAKQYPQCVPDHSVSLVYPGETVELDGLRVDVGRAFHPLDARAYRFTDTESGASIVFTGDTIYHEALPVFARDCDVLVHEASSHPNTDLMTRQRVLHSTPQDAARVANESGAGELVLVHYPAAHQDEIIERAQQDFAKARLGVKGARLDLLAPGHSEWILPPSSS